MNDKDGNLKKSNDEMFISYLIGKIKGKQLDFLKKGFKGIAEEKKIFDEARKQKEEKYLAYENIMSFSRSTREYYILLVISCLIALFGLYQNSPATIIGAMIVAPLMGPILGFSASILWGNIKDLMESILSIVKGIVLVLIITSILTFILPNVSVNTEILSRANPAVYDILIAISCGLIGAFGAVNRKVSSTLTGVAISVALMPPLCAAGIGIGLLNIKITAGALLLFVINLLGISLGSIVIFYMVKLHPYETDENEKNIAKRRALNQIIISTILIIIISALLLYFSYPAYEISREKAAVNKIISGHLKEDKIYSLELLKDKEKIVINAIMLGNSDISDSDKMMIGDEISKKIKRTVDLKLFSINNYKN